MSFRFKDRRKLTISFLGSLWYGYDSPWVVPDSVSLVEYMLSKELDIERWVLFGEVIQSSENMFE